MMRLSIAVVALAAITSLPVAAKTIPDGCYPAVQNWVNGSGYTCPIMGGSAVGAAPAPVVPTTEVEFLECASVDMNKHILPPALRKDSMSDQLALQAVECD